MIWPAAWLEHRSPIQVLTGIGVAWLQWSDGNWSPHGHVLPVIHHLKEWLKKTVILYSHGVFCTCQTPGSLITPRNYIIAVLGMHDGTPEDDVLGISSQYIFIYFLKQNILLEFWSAVISHHFHWHMSHLVVLGVQLTCIRRKGYQAEFDPYQSLNHSKYVMFNAFLFTVISFIHFTSMLRSCTHNCCHTAYRGVIWACTSSSRQPKFPIPLPPSLKRIWARKLKLYRRC